MKICHNFFIIYYFSSVLHFIKKPFLYETQHWAETSIPKIIFSDVFNKFAVLWLTFVTHCNFLTLTRKVIFPDITIKKMILNTWKNIKNLKPLTHAKSHASYLTYFTPLVSFFTPWKHQKISGFLMFSGGITWWDQWHNLS